VQEYHFLWRIEKHKEGEYILDETTKYIKELNHGLSAIASLLIDKGILTREEIQDRFVTFINQDQQLNNEEKNILLERLQMFKL